VTVDQQAEAEMRKQVMGVYPGTTWAKKVAAMKRDQLYAIWLRFRKENKL
jgi:hypothetical protein